MEASVLMINDWVYKKSPSLKQEDRYIPYQIKAEDFACEGFFDKCKPIPLTVSILLKNGFIEDDDHDWFVYEDNRHFFIIEFSRDYYSDEIVEDSFIAFNMCECLTVHYLQQALKLRGLKDFADNLKID